jgi:hypothetical protein
MGNVVIAIPLIYSGEKLNYTDDQKVEFMVMQLTRLIDLGALKGTIDEFMQDFDFSTDGYVKAVIDESAIGLTDQFNTVGGSFAPEYEVKEVSPLDVATYEDAMKLFSVSSINDRMRIAMRDPKQRFRYTILDFKRYYNSKKRKIQSDPKFAEKLRNIFMTDVMGMMVEVLPYIEVGKQLAQLVGTNQVSPGLNKIARELSLAYKLALRQEKQAGMINKTKYANLKEKYSEFMQILIDTVMPGINEAISGEKPEQKEESRKYSLSKDGRIRMFSEDQVQTEQQQEREAINAAAAEENAALREEINHSEEGSQKEYTRSSDGRIKLF